MPYFVWTKTPGEPRPNIFWLFPVVDLLADKILKKVEISDSEALSNTLDQLAKTYPLDCDEPKQVFEIGEKVICKDGGEPILKLTTLKVYQIQKLIWSNDKEWWVRVINDVGEPGNYKADRFRRAGEEIELKEGTV